MVKLIKFVIIGGAATLLQFFLLWLFVTQGTWPPVLASATSYCCSAALNYLANYYLTFASTSSHAKTLPKFMVTVALGAAFSTVLYAIIFAFLKNHVLHNTQLQEDAYLIAQLFATLATLVLNFLMHKFWIYRSK